MAAQAGAEGHKRRAALRTQDESSSCDVMDGDAAWKSVPCPEFHREGDISLNESVSLPPLKKKKNCPGT
jgi:hypothetical protein